jgi:hypothetical protein
MRRAATCKASGKPRCIYVHKHEFATQKNRNKSQMQRAAKQNRPHIPQNELKRTKPPCPKTPCSIICLFNKKPLSMYNIHTAARKVMQKREENFLGSRNICILAEGYNKICTDVYSNPLFSPNKQPLVSPFWVSTRTFMPSLDLLSLSLIMDCSLHCCCSGFFLWSLSRFLLRPEVLKSPEFFP